MSMTEQGMRLKAQAAVREREIAALKERLELVYRKGTLSAQVFGRMAAAAGVHDVEGKRAILRSMGLDEAEVVSICGGWRVWTGRMKGGLHEC